MSALRIPIILFLGIVIFFSLAFPQTITQKQFLERLKETHPLFEKGKLTAQIHTEEQKSLLGVSDWNVISSIFYSHEEPSFAVMGPEKTNAINISGGFEKMLWNSGGRISATYTGNYVDLTIDPMFGMPNSYFENKLAVTYVHPLMQNKNGFLDKLEFNLKQYDIDLSEIVALENEEDFLVEQAVKFLDWVFLLEQQKIIQQRLKLSEEQLENTREKRKANLIDEVDVIRAEDAVRIARQNLLLIETRLKALQAELAKLTEDESYNDMYPDYDLYKMTQLPPLEETSDLLSQKARLLRSLKVAIKKLDYVREGYNGLKKPNLSAVAQLSLKNAEYSYGRSLAMDKPDALIGLQLNYPIGYNTAKSKISQTDYQIMHLEKQIEEISLTLTSALANVHTQISELENVLKLNREQIDSAKRKTKEELKLYNQGRGQLTFVIQSRDSEQMAKLTYATNALMYHKLLLQYQSLMDQLHQ